MCSPSRQAANRNPSPRIFLNLKVTAFDSARILRSDAFRGCLSGWCCQRTFFRHPHRHRFACFWRIMPARLDIFESLSLKYLIAIPRVDLVEELGSRGSSPCFLAGEE